MLYSLCVSPSVLTPGQELCVCGSVQSETLYLTESSKGYNTLLSSVTNKTLYVGQSKMAKFNHEAIVLN